MPEKNPENWVAVTFLLKWIVDKSQLLAAFALSFVVAVLRTRTELLAAFAMSFVVAVLRTVKDGKLDLIEAGLCGMLTLSSYSLVEYLGFPLKISIFVGGMIAWLGTAWCKKYVKAMLLWALTKAGLMKERDF